MTEPPEPPKVTPAMDPQDQPPTPPSRLRAALPLIGLAALVLALVAATPFVPEPDPVWIHQTATALGAFGPVVLVALMVVAVVVSPIPSGPIAMAAGALYGATGGGVVSAIGAEIGAVIAFCLARRFGYAAVQRSENAILKRLAQPRSQTGLMLIVFASRLVPFLSFDAISYAAGLSPLTLPRFAFATALGVVPISWALAATGAGMTNSGFGGPLLLVLGALITLPPALLALRRR